ncbi:MAG: Ig-like domain-containing protein, partial [Gemmatimonadota bacterium]|nr:Ig-like domain-containing protein [Gemmatimonadota bacterium]
GSGLVSGIAAGSATITATSEGQSGTAAVTVAVAPVASVSVTPSTASIFVSSTVQLTATLRDAAGNVLTGRPISWSSNNPGVATVNASGLATGVAAGSAAITATSEGQSGAGQVDVLTQNPGDTQITGISFDWSTYRKLATGSDNWPLTWCEDGHQYTSWGDGEGFQDTGNDPGLGFARIEGATHANWSATDLYEGPRGGGSDGGKVESMLCINGILYALRSPSSNSSGFDYKEVWRSTDKGSSWSTVSGSRLVGDATGAPGLPFYINYGQNYTANTDGYVYIYSIRIADPNNWEVQKPGVTWLARAPVANEEFMYPANWEWVTGFNGTTPIWGTQANRTPVLEDPDGVMRSSALYLPAFDRYVMVTNHTARNLGNIAIWEAPEPWGPWTLVLKEFGWPQGGEVSPRFAFGNFSPKWLDSAGNCVFVWFRPDAWNSVACRFATEP